MNLTPFLAIKKPVMRLGSIFVVVALICAAPDALARSKRPPDAPADTPVYVSDAFQKDRFKSAAYSIPDSYYGVSSYTKGSVALGVLLGPIGAFANAAKLRADGKAQGARSSLYEFDAKALVAAGDARILPGVAQGTRFFALTPAITYYYKSDTDFSVLCLLNAELYADGRKSWDSRYVINREIVYSSQDAAVMDKVQSHLDQCFEQAVGLFYLHKDHGDAAFKDAEIVFGKRKVTWPVVHDLLPERVVSLDVAGLYDWDHSWWQSASLKWRAA